MSVLRRNALKVYVKVRADHLIDGRVRPLMFRTEDGPAVRIDRVTDVRQAPALKAGGQGIRYTCMAGGQEVRLFYDEPYWFTEREEDAAQENAAK